MKTKKEMLNDMRANGIAKIIGGFLIETTKDCQRTRRWRLIESGLPGYADLPGRGGRTTLNAALEIIEEGTA